MSIEDVQRHFSNIAGNIEKIADAACQAGAEVIRDRAKENLYPGHGYLTGALQQSIIADQQELSPERAVYRVGPSKDAEPVVPGKPKPIEYAIFVEYGTGKHKPIQYMRPAYDEHKGDALAAIENVIREGLTRML